VSNLALDISHCHDRRRRDLWGPPSIQPIVCEHHSNPQNKNNPGWYFRVLDVTSFFGNQYVKARYLVTCEGAFQRITQHKQRDERANRAESNTLRFVPMRIDVVCEIATSIVRPIIMLAGP